MPTIKQNLLGLALATGVLVPGQVLADRPPSPEERSRIETMLRNEAFQIEAKSNSTTSLAPGRSPVPMLPTAVDTLYGFIRIHSGLLGASRMTID
jgi:hypothetical protein